MPDIINRFAKDSEGTLISAEKASKGLKYYCPNCGGEFTLKKSERRLRRPHFAHKIDTSNCTPDNILHKTFQILLYNKIRDHLLNGHPLEIIWNCLFCDGTHKGNLLKNISEVKMEYNLIDCIPDIALLDSPKKVFSVIEIIVTHAPEEKALRYYKLNNIILIKFILKSDIDIDRLDNSVLKPDNIDICLNPKCKTCGEHMFKQYLYIIDGDCWQCKKPMKIAIKGTHSLMIGGPDCFDQKEISLSHQNGVTIKRRYSKTLEKRYMANVCLNCNGFTGQHYLPECFFNALDCSFRFIMLDVGYFCDYCCQNSL